MLSNGKVEPARTIDLSKFMLTDYVKGVKSAVNQASPTRYILQSVISADNLNDPKKPEEAQFTVHLRCNATYLSVASNGAICPFDEDDENQNLIKTLIYTCEDMSSTAMSTSTVADVTSTEAKVTSIEAEVTSTEAKVMTMEAEDTST